MEQTGKIYTTRSESQQLKLASDQVELLGGKMDKISNLNSSDEPAKVGGTFMTQDGIPLIPLLDEYGRVSEVHRFRKTWAEKYLGGNSVLSDPRSKGINANKMAQNDGDFVTDLRLVFGPIAGVLLYLSLGGVAPFLALWCLWFFVVPNGVKSALEKQIGQDLNIPLGSLPNIAKSMNASVAKLAPSIFNKNKMNAEYTELLLKMVPLMKLCNNIRMYGTKLPKADNEKMLEGFNQFYSKSLTPEGSKTIIRDFTELMTRRGSNGKSFIERLSGGDSKLEQEIKENYEGVLEFFKQNSKGVIPNGIDKFIESFKLVLSKLDEREQEVAKTNKDERRNQGSPKLTEETTHAARLEKQREKSTDDKKVGAPSASVL